MKEEKKRQRRLLFSIIRIRYPKYHPFWFIFYMYARYLCTVKRSYKYNLRSVSTEYIKKFVTKNNHFGDINNIVLVFHENIYESDRLLTLYDEESQSTRLVYALPTKKCERYELLVGDTQYHNLSNRNVKYPLRLLKAIPDCLKIADEINLSLVSCPFDVSSALSDALIERYFRKPKLLQKGDLIEIDIKYFAEDIFFLKGKVNRVHSIFYRCNNVIFKNEDMSDSCFCVLGETAIKQGVDIQSFLPKISTQVVPGAINEISKCPYGLEGHLEQMLMAVKPFLRNLKLPLKPIFLLDGNTGCGREVLVSCLAARLGMHYYRIDNCELMANVYAQNETKLHNCFFDAKMAAPCVVAVHNFENFGKNNDGQYDERIMGNFVDETEFLFRNNQFPVALFCCTNRKDIPSELKKSFLQTFEIRAPSEEQRERNLKWLCEEKNYETSADLAQVAGKTHGFFFEDLRALTYYAKRNCQKERNGTIIDRHFSQAVDYMQSNYNESIGAPKVPKVFWSDVGGLIDVKEEISKTINLPLKHPDIFEKSGLKRSGILLFGPPGTGKTLIAKAVATECSLCFLSVKGPELLNMYIGQSEQNIREVFERARSASPCIIFFDELDSLAPNRGMSGDSGGVMDRVVSQLLAEMDGLNDDSATIFIIGATNRPDLIDPALMRPGRFDKLLYIGPCVDDVSKMSVLKALTRKFNLAEDVDLSEVVKVCPKNITGADFYGICSNAWLFAVRRLIERFENGSHSSKEVGIDDDDVVVKFDDFRQAMMEATPSISPRDLLYFEKLKLELSCN